MAVTTVKMNGAGRPAEEDQSKADGAQSTTSNPSTTTAMELSEEARAAISELRAIREEAQRDLNAVLPPLEAAFRALKKLRKQDIVELQAMEAPPARVKLAMEAVCVMFRLEADEAEENEDDGESTCASSSGSRQEGSGWDAAKRLLSDPKFLTRVLNYDKDSISEATIRQLAPYLEMKGLRPRDEAALRKSSVACEALCGWLRAIYFYHRAAKAVAPKRGRLRQLQARLVELQGRKKEPAIAATPEKTPPPPPPALPGQAEALGQEADQAELKQPGSEKEP